MLEIEIGKRIRAARCKKGLRLADLASSSGFSAGLLSKIESGKVSSPITTLEVIARALGTSFERLVVGDGAAEASHDISKDITIVRKKERVHHSVTYAGVLSTYEWLAPNMENKQMEPFIINLPKEHAPQIYSHHPGQEIVFVLEGKLLLNYRRQSFILDEGDCAYFDATVAHRVRSAGDKKLKLLCVRSVF